MSKLANKTQTSKHTSKYIRIPIDKTIEDLINDLRLQNPFFTELDAIRYVLGKFIVQNKRQQLLKSLTSLKQLHLDTPEISEDGIFEILKQNDLI